MAEWPYSTARWQRLRKLKLSDQPQCEGCLPHRHVLASHVDHVKPISDGGHPFPALDQLTSYCLPCHSAKTARGAEAGAVRTSKPRRGCNPDGSPLDPDHAWNKSLRAGALGARGDRKTQLVANSNREGGHV